MVVPKYRAGSLSSSTSIASRSTVKYVSFFGKPVVSRFQDSPPFSLRQTAGTPPGQVRVIGSSGST